MRCEFAPCAGAVPIRNPRHRPQHFTGILHAFAADIAKDPGTRAQTLSLSRMAGERWHSLAFLVDAWECSVATEDSNEIQ